jgi:hypothetical protein
VIYPLARYLLCSAREETTMNPLDAQSACAGTWRGTSTLQDPHAGIAAESPSKLSVGVISGGVRLDHTWAWKKGIGLARPPDRRFP